MIDCRIETAQLRKALVVPKQLASVKSPDPRASLTRLATSGSGLVIEAVRSEERYRHQLLAESKADGVAFVDGASLHERIGRLTEEHVRLVERSGRLGLVSGRRYYDLPMTMVEAWESPIYSGREDIQVSASTLASLVDRSLSYVSDDWTRASQAGLRLAMADASLVALATDGQRLTMVSHLLGRVGRPFDAYMPKPAAKRLRDLALAAGEAILGLSVAAGCLHVSGLAWEYVATLLTVEQVHVRRVLGMATPRTTLTLTALALREGVDAARLPGDSDIEIRSEDGKIWLRGDEPGFGLAEVEVDGLAESSMRLRMSPRFLSEALRGLEDDTSITLGFSGPSDPLLVNVDGLPTSLLCPRVLPKAP